MIAPRATHSHRRGSVIVVALWAVAIAAIITSAVQLTAHRQAMMGREAVARAQARWAARGGVEYTIAVMAVHTEDPIPDDAFAMVADMETVSHGEFAGANYSIQHTVDFKTFNGPMDEHSKMNVNVAAEQGFLSYILFEDLSFDVIDAITDWIDADDEPSQFGVERDWYLSLPSPYEPRNEPIRSLAELELVAGVWPKNFRGEDWNLNNRMDANENDGEASWPDYDEPDDRFDAGYSGWLTPYTIDNGATESGEWRLHLSAATLEDLTARLNVDPAQAQALIDFGGNPENSLIQLLTQPLGVNQDAAQQQPNADPSQLLIPPLTDAQLRDVLAETSIANPLMRTPGRMNINTVPDELLHRIFEQLQLDPIYADEIIYMRQSRPEGIPSLVDLQSIPDLSDEDLSTLGELFTTSSDVFTITSVGRSVSTGLEVEMIVVVDRSILPIRILEYREQ